MSNDINIEEIPNDLSELPDSPPAEDPMQFHGIAKTWQAVLEPAREEALAPPTPDWSSKIIQTYADLKFQDMIAVRDLYFELILEMAEILDSQIEENPCSLKVTTPEEDAEENSTLYKNVLLLWQQAFLAAEMEWDCMSVDAAAKVAAISECHKMFFGQTGIVAFLQNIPFDYDADDQALVAEALEAMKAEK